MAVTYKIAQAERPIYRATSPGYSAWSAYSQAEADRVLAFAMRDEERPAAANDNLPRVIAFTGAAGSGKSTAADYLISRGYVRVKFAAPLKAMCRALGMTEAQIEGDEKESPADILQGRTPRYVMQTLGTEWGRDLIGPKFWTGIWEASVRACLEEGGRVVCDDCRFPNEAAAVMRLGGKVYRLTGRGGIQGGHESERGDFIVDRVIANDGSPEALYRAIAA